jgi:hypothetical protein
MRYKCHYCEKYLQPGMQFTLQCQCNNCLISFNKKGEIEYFYLIFFEKGCYHYLVKDVFSGGDIDYLVSSDWRDQTPKGKKILKINLNLNIGEDGLILAYDLFNKINKLIILS